MAAMKPRTGDGPMEAVKEGRLIIVRVPLEGGGRLVVSVNDAFVMKKWAEATGGDGKIDFLADGSGDFAKGVDMVLDASANGLGIRSKRYSMLVEDGVVKKFNVEEAPGKCEVSGGQALLGQI